MVIVIIPTTVLDVTYFFALLPFYRQKDVIFMPILKVEKLRPEVAQNLHRFKHPVGGGVETRTQAS